MCHDTNMAVWEADLGAGVGGGVFMRRFLGWWWGGSRCVLLHGRSGGPPLWVSPLGVYLRDSGSVPLRGLDLKNFVHGLLSMGLGP